MIARPALAAVVLALNLAPTPAAAAVPQPIRIVEVVQRGRTVDAVIALPPLLSGRTLAPSAFSFRQGGASLTATVTRIALASTALTVVVDVPADQSEALTTVQGAISDFIVQLPKDVRVAVTPLTPALLPLPDADHGTALKSLASFEPTVVADPDGALAALLKGVAANTIERSTVIVVTAQLSALDGQPALLSGGRLLVYSVVKATAARGDDAPRSVTVTRWSTPDNLLAAMDTIAAGLAGQYRVVFSAPAAGPVELAAEASGIRAEGRVELAETEPVNPSAVTAASAVAPVPRTPQALQRDPANDSVTPAPSRGYSSKVAIAIIGLVGWFGIVALVAAMRSRRVAPANARHETEAEIQLPVDAPRQLDLTDGRQRDRAPAPGRHRVDPGG